MTIPQTEIGRAFTLIEAAAIAGERCPMNEPFGPIPNGAMDALYATGRVRGEIYAKNFRVAVILTGPHAGKRTALPKRRDGGDLSPWKIVAQDGTRFLRQRFAFVAAEART